MTSLFVVILLSTLIISSTAIGIEYKNQCKEGLGAKKYNDNKIYLIIMLSFAIIIPMIMLYLKFKNKSKSKVLSTIVSNAKTIKSNVNSTNSNANLKKILIINSYSKIISKINSFKYLEK